jgi:hypothetical protein
MQYEMFNKTFKETIGIKVKREKETKIKKLRSIFLLPVVTYAY